MKRIKFKLTFHLDLTAGCVSVSVFAFTFVPFDFSGTLTIWRPWQEFDLLTSYKCLLMGDVFCNISPPTYNPWFHEPNVCICCFSFPYVTVN